MSSLVRYLACSPLAVGGALHPAHDPAAHRASPPTGAPVESRAAPDAPTSAALGLPRIALTNTPPPILAAELDDAAPLPVRTRAADGAAETASGDPYFLGFLAGDYRPPSGQRVDPALLASIQPQPLDQRPAPTVYAFAMLERRITPARIAELESRGARVLGFHPSNCVKLAIPVAAFELVAADPDIHWLGAARDWQRVEPRLASQLASAAADAEFELVIDVFESDWNADSTEEAFGSVSRADHGSVALEPANSPTLARRAHSNGWQERALAASGATVHEYDEVIRAFKVRASVATVARILALDFVQYVERDAVIDASHDNSTPMLDSDTTRVFYNGGSTHGVVAGEIDSGVDVGHTDLQHIWGWGWLFGGTGSAWNDVCEHGSHVAGTFFGDGSSIAAYRGNAPGLGWGPTGRVFVIKASDQCQNWGLSLPSAVGVMHSSLFDGVNWTPPPHVINNSWETIGGWYNGTEADARTVDAEVFAYGQLYAFAAGNSGPGAGTIGLQASAKNVLSVGNVAKGWSVGNTLPGDVMSSSSRGPTADGRWKPNVCAPGQSINSVDANSGNGYVQYTGTSMACPHVSGVAAQVMDAYASLRYVPEQVDSLLMATAMTRGNQLLTTSTDQHLRDYGTGRVEAYRALFGTAQSVWTVWGSYLPPNTWTYSDFQISPGCTRVVVCMHYVEPQASAGASQALINDIDLMIDQPPIDPNGNTSDYTLQHSSVDNTEIRILDNPTPGVWRWKLWPNISNTGVYYGVTVAEIYGAVSSHLAPVVAPLKINIKPGELDPITVTVTNPSYVASDVVIEPTYNSFGGALANPVYKYLGDGALAYSPSTGADVPMSLGNILHGSSRSATWITSWASEGLWGFWCDVRGDGLQPITTAGFVVVDGTPPGAVSALTSNFPTNHWSSATSATVSWSAAPDNLSGLAGYAIAQTLGSPSLPFPNQGYGNITSLATSLLEGANYFNIRSVDNSGNWETSYANYGPMLVDVTPPSGATNVHSSTHQTGLVSCSGSITMNWNVGSDALSGIAGYAALWDHSPSSSPGSSVTVNGNVAGSSFTLTTSAQPWYFHIAAVDQAANVSSASHAGPYFINTSPASTYCTPKVNSHGCTPTIAFNGAPSLANSSFHVTATQLINNKSAILFWGASPNAAPFQGGTLCVGAPLKRITLPSTGGTPPPTIDCSGSLDYLWSSSALQASGIGIGHTLYNQFWSRDPQSPSTTSLTAGVQFIVCQ